MDRLKKFRSVDWAGVEFQPNLSAPAKPIRLGAVLLEACAVWSSVMVIGRMPNLDARPHEFEGVSEIMMKIAAKWVDSMFKDVTDAGHEGKFDYLADRWKWNLYIVKPKVLRAPDLQGNLETIGKRIYQRFVGEPFDEKAVKPSGETKQQIPGLAAPLVVPPAWQLDEFKRRTMEQLGT